MALTAERIVEAACSILDTYGLADLTMRRVAEVLGVKAGALYWHFPNKQTLLAAVADEVLAAPNQASNRCDEDRDKHGDEDRLARWASDLRDRLLAHRDAAELVASTRAMGLGRVDPAEHARETLLARCIGDEEADGMAQAFLHFVLGHVMEEQTQSQLATLGVVSAFDGARSQRYFDWGVRVIQAGVRRQGNALPHEVE